METHVIIWLAVTFFLGVMLGFFACALLAANSMRREHLDGRTFYPRSEDPDA